MTYAPACPQCSQPLKSGGVIYQNVTNMARGPAAHYGGVLVGTSDGIGRTGQPSRWWPAQLGSCSVDIQR